MPGTAALLIAVMLAASPVSAQLYKWVDERGVTNYSNQPPGASVASGALRSIDNRVSVYSPDPALTQAVESFRRDGALGAAAATPRTGDEHRQQGAPVATLDPCLNGDAIGCGTTYAGYVPYDPGYGYVRPPFHRPRHIPQRHLRPGAIAGAVVGMDGYIPGYSAYAPPARAQPAPRALYEMPVNRGSARR